MKWDVLIPCADMRQLVSMGEPSSTEQSTSGRFRASEIVRQIARWVLVDRDNREVEQSLRDLLVRARTPSDAPELRPALASLCYLIAEEKPLEVIELAKEFRSLPDEEDHQKALVLFALSIAHRRLGDEVRAEQYRRVAMRLENEIGESDLSLWAAFRSDRSRTSEAEQFINLTEPLDSWLAKKSRISLSDLRPTFGEFVTNDRVFYREATGHLKLLARRVRAKLSKPDNYLLLADPGSGKSFFVRQFTEQLIDQLGEHVTFLERNLSAYTNIDQAFNDIATDVLVALATHKPILLFIDEVDTQLDDRSMFQRLIAPMNGDPFFFLQKQVSFAKQDIVVFFALSSRIDDLGKRQKWPDFLSRIPSAHQIKLPAFNSPIDRIYRTIAMLPKGPFPVTYVEASALLYIGLRIWTSVRELEQALDLAKMRCVSSSSRVLELAHIALSTQDVDQVAKEGEGTYDIFGGPTNVLEIG